MLKKYKNILFIFLLLVILLNFKVVYAVSNKYEIKYEYVNTNNLAVTDVSKKIKGSSNNIYGILKNLFTSKEANYNLKSIKEEIENPVSEIQEEVVTWHLPTNVGSVTQYPSYYHPALDIISPNGVYESVYPVRDGVVSSMYRDAYGALIVTILHDVDHKKYTSQYVHLSSYAPDLYVGKVVSWKDPIGQMGDTGMSYGVHLHISVVDCGYLDPNDYNCNNLGSFLNYASRRVNDGYYGLSSLIIVPSSWENR